MLNRTVSGRKEFEAVPASRRPQPWWKTRTIIGIFSGLMLLLIGVVHNALPKAHPAVNLPEHHKTLVVAQAPIQKRYGIVIDAGSSGSRLHVFAYLPAGAREGEVELAGNSTLPEILLPNQNLKQKPGLSSFSSNPSAAGQTLIPLLDFALQQVPAEAQSTTPLFLMATAGLRRVEADTADLILESCRDVLERSPFKFEREWASIITGDKEGIFGWVAANYASGSLKKRDPAQTVGVLEMGGASAQVTFIPEEQPPEEVRRSVELDGVHYELYTHSFLGLGQEAAQESLAQALVHGGVTARGPTHPPPPEGDTDAAVDSVVDPCTPAGFVGSELTIVGRPMVHDKVVEEALAGRSVLPRGNLTACQRAAERLLKEGAAGVPTPALHGSFLATENFFYTAEFLGLGTSASLAEVAVAGGRYCASEWEDLVAAHGPEPGGKRSASTGRSEEELLKYCFSSAYMVAFLHSAWGLALDATNVMFSNSVGSISLDWVLGALLLEVVAAAAPPEARETIEMDIEDVITPTAPARGASTASSAYTIFSVALFGVSLMVGVYKWRSLHKGGMMIRRLSFNDLEVGDHMTSTVKYSVD